MMRKFGIKFAAHHPQGDAVKLEFIRCKNVADWKRVIETSYQAEVVQPSLTA